jgi:trimeric autotransporter adhesin
MKKQFIGTSMGVFALMSAHAQVPSTNDTSDSTGNTGVGSNTLQSLIINGAIGTGIDNTAVGYRALQSNTTAAANTAVGAYALNSNTTGASNVAIGGLALSENTTGSNNIAIGSGTSSTALGTNLTGSYNLAIGNGTLFNIKDGSYNMAIGSAALNQLTSGTGNIAIGFQALTRNQIGTGNTVVGFEAAEGSADTTFCCVALGNYNSVFGYLALGRTTTGNNNSAFGALALLGDTTGIDNNAFGYYALRSNTTGYGNVAHGSWALGRNNSGNRNIGIGNQSLAYVSTGGYNIGIGYGAGWSLTIGSNNIDIANPGNSTDGVAANSGIIRIGTQSPTALQTQTYIAGIYENSTVSGLAVVIDSNGQLGAVASSERFKTDIEPMASNTEKLQQLRPVKFHYKTDPQSTLRYGLIAEEVAKVYPELVVKGQNGRIDGVRYDEITPLLLNELQKAQATIATQDQRIGSLEQQLAGIQAALVKLQTKDELVAQR